MRYLYSFCLVCILLKMSIVYIFNVFILCFTCHCMSKRLVRRLGSLDLTHSLGRGEVHKFISSRCIPEKVVRFQPNSVGSKSLLCLLRSWPDATLWG